MSPGALLLHSFSPLFCTSFASYTLESEPWWAVTAYRFSQNGAVVVSALDPRAWHSLAPPTLKQWKTGMTPLLMSRTMKRDTILCWWCFPDSSNVEHQQQTHSQDIWNSFPHIFFCRGSLILFIVKYSLPCWLWQLTSCLFNSEKLLGFFAVVVLIVL